MQVMVELQDGTVHSFEELEVLGYNPLVIAFTDETDYQAIIGKVRRFFTWRKEQ
jgi:hypothetical protein